MADVLEKIALNLYSGKDKIVAKLVRDALDQDIEPGKVLSDGLIAGMGEVGEGFKAGDFRGVCR